MTIIGSGATVNTPSAPSAVAISGGGSLGAGDYLYKVSYITTYGETLPSSASTAMESGASGRATVTIPVSSNALVTSRNIYRTQADGTSYTLVTTVENNTATTYTDSASDASISGNGPPKTTSSADSLQLINGFVKIDRPLIAGVTSGITAGVGGTQGAATQLLTQWNTVVTVASANDSVLLPALTENFIGMQIGIRNAHATNAIRIFPAVGQTINGGSANASITLAAVTGTMLVATSDANWAVVL